MGKRGGVFAEARPGIEQRNAEMLRRYKTGENLASIGASWGFTPNRDSWGSRHGVLSDTEPVIADDELFDPKVVVRRGYDSISHAYRDNSGAGNVGYSGWLETYLLPRLSRSARVLDLGCGNGVPATRMLAEHYDVVGVDISDVQISRARELVPKGTFLRADMTAVEFAPQSLDAVVSFFALIHVPVDEQRALLTRVSTWLRPGGLLLATVGKDAWTGIDDFYGATMYWSQTDAGTYCAWLDQVGIRVVAQEFIPEEPHGGHELILGMRRAKDMAAGSLHSQEKQVVIFSVGMRACRP